MGRMLRPLAAFHDSKIPLTSEYMCRSSLYVISPSVSVTSSLPMGCILWPLTARGVTLEGSRLYLCLPKCFMAYVPATEMSAPRLGRVFRTALPLRDEMWTLIVGLVRCAGCRRPKKSSL